jgi:Ca-activated chloride channel family protein
MSVPLTLTCTLASTIYPVTDQSRLVYLLVEVTGGKGASALPVNLGLVIDSSDSMRIRLVTDEQFTQLARYGNAQEVLTDGIPAYQITSVPGEVLSKFPRRIDYVSEALVIASEYLRPTDCYSLVAFAAQAVVMIQSTSGRERSRLAQAAHDLESLNLGDATQMDQGLGLSLDEVQRKSTTGNSCEHAGRLILLTDGHTRNVNECYAWAKKARQIGLTLSTMGIGNEFNEELLIPLADLTGGNAYYIETPDQIPAAFRKELGAALRVSYRNVDIKIRFPSGVTLRRAHRALPLLGNFEPGPDMGGSYALLLSNYDPTEPQGLLLEMIIPPWKAGSYRLAQAVLSWDDPDGSPARPNQRREVIIQMAENASTLSAASPNQRVMNIIEKVGAFKLGTQALEEAQRGDRSAATQRLRQAATRLLDMGENGLADAMRRQADILESDGQLDPNTTKKLRYETRRITQRTDR